jgi:Fe-S-cluster-containing hydrogenase component 2
MKNKKRQLKSSVNMKIKGIKDIPKGSKDIHRQFQILRKRLVDKFPMPEVKYKGPKYVKRGSTIALEVKGLPLPDVDLWNGVLKKHKTNSDNGLIKAMLSGDEKPAILPARYDEKKKRVLVTIPDNAENGILMLLFPVFEFLGEHKDLKKIDPEDAIIRKEVGNTCTCEKTDGGDPEKCLFLDRQRYDAARYYAVYAVYVKIRCTTCAVGCPHGAIKFDEDGLCYVDIEECRGQSYALCDTEILPDGREVFVNGYEIKCWECFVGDERYSAKCVNRKLRRVAYNNGECCGDCTDMNMLAGLNLMDLCPYGAVTRIGHYTIEPELCEGCFLCIYNIACTNNSYHDEFNTRTLRMVSHIGKPLALRYLEFDRIEFQCTPEQLDEAQQILPIRLCAVVESEIERDEVIFMLEQPGPVEFNNVRVKFYHDVHIVLRIFDPELDQLVNFDRGLGAAVRTVTLPPSAIRGFFFPRRRRINFQTPFGAIVFEVVFKELLQMSVAQESLGFFGGN